MHVTLPELGDVVTYRCRLDPAEEYSPSRPAHACAWGIISSLYQARIYEAQASLLRKGILLEVEIAGVIQALDVMSSQRV